MTNFAKGIFKNRSCVRHFGTDAPLPRVFYTSGF